MREYGFFITCFKSIPEAESRTFNVFILAQIDKREHLKVRRALHNVPTSVNFTDPLRLQNSVAHSSLQNFILIQALQEVQAAQAVQVSLAQLLRSQLDFINFVKQVDNDVSELFCVSLRFKSRKGEPHFSSSCYVKHLQYNHVWVQISDYEAHFWVISILSNLLEDG